MRFPAAVLQLRREPVGQQGCGPAGSPSGPEWDPNVPARTPLPLPEPGSPPPAAVEKAVLPGFVSIWQWERTWTGHWQPSASQIPFRPLGVVFYSSSIFLPLSTMCFLLLQSSPPCSSQVHFPHYRQELLKLPAVPGSPLLTLCASGFRTGCSVCPDTVPWGSPCLAALCLRVSASVSLPKKVTLPTMFKIAAGPPPGTGVFPARLYLLLSCHPALLTSQ